MQGHAFGEPLRNFSGLVLITKEDERGGRVYQMPPAKERGWFGKHAQDFATYYQFQDGRFAMFRAVTTGLGANRTAMREEARFLYGPGKDRNDQMSGLDWEGERVRVMYSEKLTSPVQCWLEVYSKPLLVVQQTKRRAQLRAGNEVSKPQSASSSPRGDKLTLDFISPSVSLYWTDPAPHRAGSVRQPPTTRVAQRPHTGLTVPRSSTSPPSLRPYATRYC